MIIEWPTRFFTKELNSYYSFQKKDFSFGEIIGAPTTGGEFSFSFFFIFVAQAA